MEPILELHDKLFRQLVKDTGRVTSLLKMCLPDNIRADLDFEKAPTRYDSALITGTGKKTQADAIFRLHVKGDPKGRALVIMEHKSRPDPNTRKQLLGYALSLGIQELQNSKDDQLSGLPPVIQLIFYHGQKRWKNPPNQRILQKLPRSLKICASAFGNPIFIDLCRIPENELPVEPALRGALVAFIHSDAKSVSDAALDTIVKGIDSTEFGIYLYRYVGSLSGVSEKRLKASCRRVGFDKITEENLMTQVELSWYEEVRQRGLAEGEVKGKAEFLITLLERRFGHLSDENIQCIRNANESQLENWFDRAFDSDNLNGLLVT